MSTVAGVQKHGERVGAAISSLSGKQVTVDRAPTRQGTVYQVLVFDSLSGERAAYVPAATYSCRREPGGPADLPDCHSIAGSRTHLAVCAFAALVGACVCVTAHRTLKTWMVEVFAFGFALVGAVVYMVVARFLVHASNHDELPAIIGGVGGVVGGALLLALWWFWDRVLTVLGLIGVVMGLLVSGLLFATPFGQLSVWRYALSYWMVLVGVAMCLAMTLVQWPRALSMLSCAVVCSFAIMSLVDYLVDGTLAMGVVMNIVYHASVEDFEKHYYGFYWGPREIGVLAGWIALSILCLLIQHYVVVKDHSVPYSRYYQRRRDTEGQPLLSHVQYHGDDGDPHGARYDGS